MGFVATSTDEACNTIAYVISFSIGVRSISERKDFDTPVPYP
ncbi:hypothetical protein PEC301879_03760 [Pectobacterium carotovorum subsp. carotovorum]|nr:hypothetical protein PEC301879_03760 [Pectobacterium carotovorum subsp. carotovorum]